jgi:hypothetical protein
MQRGCLPAGGGTVNHGRKKKSTRAGINHGRNESAPAETNVLGRERKHGRTNGETWTGNKEKHGHSELGQ